MDLNERPVEGDESKLRRWVDNLQLESWQLELLVTGFSIFLLVSSVDIYREWSADLNFNKLVPTAPIYAIFMIAISVVVEAIPYALQFFLISLLVHLLLRGFWIGIVGLSSVSNRIGLDDMNLKGPFKKYLPKKVRTLDELILYLDSISSVIFAYTYMIVFSIISVVLVSAITFAFLGIATGASFYLDNKIVAVLVSLLSMLTGIIFAIGAVLFFLDSLLFSAIKKSGWLSYIYYPVYRVLSIVSLSFLYRSIYYHLITNYKKKQIIAVSAMLCLIVFISFKLEGMNSHSFYPSEDSSTKYFFQSDQYDDERKKGYVKMASIPSKFISEKYLELFIRYSPNDNMALDLICPDKSKLQNDPTVVETFNAGMQTARDTTLSANEILYDTDYEEKVSSVLTCFKELIFIEINNQAYNPNDMFFTRHKNKNEKGLLVIIDISSLPEGFNEIDIQKKRVKGNPFGRDLTAENLRFERFVTIPFWKVTD